jgi:hypothetical protein
MNSAEDTARMRWVAPFGDSGINDRSHLPRTYRSVPRPSSPLDAKAFTRCPSLPLPLHPTPATDPRFSSWGLSAFDLLEPGYPNSTKPAVGTTKNTSPSLARSPTGRERRPASFHIKVEHPVRPKPGQATQEQEAPMPTARAVTQSFKRHHTI